MNPTIKTALAFFMVAGNLLTAVPAAGQHYPAKPIRLIVPTAPGGPTDIVARILAPKLSDTFKQPVIVDNRSGSGGIIGTETAVRAAADGYSLILLSSAYAANAALYPLPYDPVNDITPVILIGETGFMVALHPALPIANVKELIAYDKANPRKLNYGSGGTGSTSHLASELLNFMAGTRIAHIPYKGASPVLTDLIGGHIQLAIGAMPLFAPQVKSNRLRGIAVTAAKRSSAVPEIPTVAETVPNYEAVTWFGVFGPKALPNDIVTRWNRELNRILLLPDVNARLADDGMTLSGGTPARYSEVLKRDVAKWQKVIQVAGIKPGN
jgi:tripartite-type tricarboxylate transporter receptor subunit TctC